MTGCCKKTGLSIAKTKCLITASCKSFRFNLTCAPLLHLNVENSSRKIIKATRCFTQKLKVLWPIRAQFFLFNITFSVAMSSLQGLLCFSKFNKSSYISHNTWPGKTVWAFGQYFYNYRMCYLPPNNVSLLQVKPRASANQLSQIFTGALAEIFTLDAIPDKTFWYFRCPHLHVFWRAGCS